MPVRGARAKLREQLRETNARGAAAKEEDVEETLTTSKTAPARSRNEKGTRRSGKRSTLTPTMTDEETEELGCVSAMPAREEVETEANKGPSGGKAKAGTSPTIRASKEKPCVSDDDDTACLVLGSKEHKALVKRSLQQMKGTTKSTSNDFETPPTAPGMGTRTTTTDTVGSAGSFPDSPEPVRNRFGAIESSFGEEPEAAAAARATTQAAQLAKKKSSTTKQVYQYLLVLDFEATTDANTYDYEHEIIEFPVTVLHAASRSVVAEFHSFVRPVKNPKLTEFCTELTGITQEQVDAAPTLPEVLLGFRRWVRTLFPDPSEPNARPDGAVPVSMAGSSSNGKSPVTPTAPPMMGEPGSPVCSPDTVLPDDLGDEAYTNFLQTNRIACFATDGPWDMRRFMLECSVLRDGIIFPKLFFNYINVRKSYANFFKSKPLTLGQMLTRQGMQFQGSQHSGRDDTRNIARVVALLMERGCVLKNVAKLPFPDEHGIAAAREVEQLLKEFAEEDQRRVGTMGKRLQNAKKDGAISNKKGGSGVNLKDMAASKKGGSSRNGGTSKAGRK